MQPERELEHSSTTHGLKLKSSNRHSLKTYGLPLQGECMGLVPEPILTDYSVAENMRYLTVTHAHNRGIRDSNCHLLETRTLCLMHTPG